MYVSLPPPKVHVALKPLPADPAAADDGVDSSTAVAAGAEEGAKSPSMAGVKAAIAAGAAAAAAGAKSPMAGGCRLSVSKPELKARLVSALETEV
jgi:hypothetical protein